MNQPSVTIPLGDPVDVTIDVAQSKASLVGAKPMGGFIRWVERLQSSATYRETCNILRNEAVGHDELLTSIPGAHLPEKNARRNSRVPKQEQISLAAMPLSALNGATRLTGLVEALPLQGRFSLFRRAAYRMSIEVWHEPI